MEWERSGQRLVFIDLKLKCKIDDIIDTICLCVTANLAAQGYFETIPENPMMDDYGLLMQMILPSCVLQLGEFVI